MAADRVVRYQFRGEIGDLQTKLAAAGRSVGKLADDMTKADKEAVRFRQGLTTMGDAAGKVSIAAAGSLALVTKAAMDWQSAFAGVEKTTDGTASQMAALEKELRGLAKTLPASHQEIAAVAEAAGQLGVQREAVAGFTSVMLDLGATTNLSADEAATSIARFSNIMGTAQTEVERIGSSLVDLGNNSATTESEILELGTRLAAAGSIAGLTEADVLAFAATLTSVGVEAEAGGTALSKVFTSVRDAALDGGEQLETFARVAGVSAGEFRQAFEEDAAGAIDMFIQGLGRINESGQSTTAIFSELELTDQRLMRALLSTASAGDLLTESLDRGTEAWEDNTALAEEAEQRYQTTAAQTAIAWNRVKDAAIEFGGAALPVVASVADSVGALADVLGGLPAPVKTATTSLAGVTALVGGAGWFTAKSINAVAGMREAITNLGVSADGTKSKMSGFLGFAGGPWGIALTAGVTLLGAYAKNQADVAAAIDMAKDSLDDQTGAITENTRVWAVNAMQEEGTLDLARKLGLDLDTVTDAVLGDTDAVEKLNDAWAKHRREVESTQDSMGVMPAELQTQSAEWTKLRGEVFGANETLNKAREEFDQTQEAMGGAKDATNGTAEAVDVLGRKYADTGDAAGATADDIDALVESMREQRSMALEAADAEIAYEAALDRANDALEDNGRTLDITTEKGRANKKALIDIAASWANLSDEQKNARGAFKDARDDLIAQAMQFGATREEARDLAKAFLEFPPLRVEADVAEATREVDGFAEHVSRTLAGIKDEPVEIGLFVREHGAAGARAAKLYGDSYGGVGGAGGPTVDVRAQAASEVPTEGIKERAAAIADELRDKYAFGSSVLPKGAYSIGMPYLGYPGHYGADYPAPIGTPVYAAGAGVVDVARSMSGSYGNHVFLDHPGGVETRYAHMTNYMVSPGQGVMPGQQIGTVGSTGNSTGPHLHFEYRVNGSPMNPAGLGMFYTGGFVPRDSFSSGGIVPTCYRKKANR
jgi:TP901 family phage tail tape measure protein